MTLPDTYIVGAPKAGTTSLAAWLAQHPDVYFSVPKEPFHWASDYPAMRRHYGFETREAYEQLFASPEATAATRVAEGSTVYLHSRTAVRDILTAVDHPRFIVAVRDPVDLLVSYHRTQLVSLNETEPDFATAWRRSLTGQPPATTPLDPKLVDYPLVGRLGAAVAALLDAVPAEDVHVVQFDRLAREPDVVWGELCRFLQLPTDFTPTFETKNVSDKMYRFATLRRLAQRPPAFLATPVRRLRQWSRTTDSSVVRKAKATMWKKENKPAVSDEVRHEVAEYFRVDQETLAAALRAHSSHSV